jgi:hypothetical protein
MTTKEARKLLGKEAKGVSDVLLEKEIEAAELFKNLFFELVTHAHKTPKTGRPLSNVP